MKKADFYSKLISLKQEVDFENLALEVFQLQANNNKVYGEFIKNLGVSSTSVKEIKQIPFLPVEIFKSQKVLTGDDTHQLIFSSSGSTGENVSRHFVKDVGFYEKIFTEIFRKFYGEVNEYVILALLPSYLERQGSSLVLMMEKLIEQTHQADSGFYLNDFEKLYETLKRLKAKRQKTILFGVTFALLDFVSAFQLDFPELIVMETGGMKGRRKELVREEVHENLCRGFGVKFIHSEYGMTELLSQAYSSGNGIFQTPPWMRVLIRDASDPLVYSIAGTSGGINIIDLANIDSCAFIATQDLGKNYTDNTFEVLGRFDFSDVRGCNLLVD
jgi:hypothetical protein